MLLGFGENFRKFAENIARVFQILTRTSVLRPYASGRACRHIFEKRHPQVLNAEFARNWTGRYKSLHLTLAPPSTPRTFPP